MPRRILAAVALLAMGLATLPFVANAADPTPQMKVERSALASFDGTPIVYNLFLPAGASASHPVPAILRGHGWGGSGEAASDPSTTLKRLVAAGYAVLTWDSRGFGQSGGEANVDDPGFEVRDASALVDLLARRPDIAKNGPGDPVIGMTGGSYAGGIQLGLAAFDHRVDAIAPEITWNDLRYSLFPHNVIKLGWGELLYGAGLATAATGGLSPTNTAGIETGAYAPGIHYSEASGTALGYPDTTTLEWFKGKGVAYYGEGHPVRVPTLLMQGSVDTLFNVNEAWANFNHVAAQGAPAKFISFCGGHVSCPSTYKDGDARNHLDAAILTWFARYLKGDKKARTGAPVEYSSQDGVWHDLPLFPTAAKPGPASVVTAKGKGSVVSAGRLGTAVDTEGINAVVAAAPSGGEPDTLTVPVLQASRPTQVVGIPHADVAITGVGAGAHLFFKLVDRENDQVLDLQSEAFRLEGPLSGDTRKISLDLVGVGYLLAAGHHLDLQVSTTSLPHVPFRGPAELDLDVTVRVPTL